MIYTWEQKSQDAPLIACTDEESRGGGALALLPIVIVLKVILWAPCHLCHSLVRLFHDRFQAISKGGEHALFLLCGRGCGLRDHRPKDSK